MAVSTSVRFGRIVCLSVSMLGDQAINRMGGIRMAKLKMPKAKSLVLANRRIGKNVKVGKGQ